MSIRLFPLVAISTIMVTPSSADAGDFLRAVVRDFQEVNQWPCPYVCWDREAVRAPFPPMVQNGWRRQNVLADCHFTANSAELSPAGQHKVRWILTEAPVEHRTIFVRRTDTPEQTSARINAVREYAAKAVSDVDPPNILETYLSPAGYPAGWPGGKDDSLSRRFQPHVPDKIYLPERKTDGSSSGN
jgi:hypothetical protein